MKRNATAAPFARNAFGGALAAAFLAFAQSAVSAQDLAAASEPSFAEWLETFKAQAIAEGVSSAVVEDAFAGVTVNERVFELNEDQPEFSRAVWDYLDRAVSQTRIEQGRTRRAQNAALFAEIEDQYGVDSEIIAAIWGLESSFGDIMGDYDAIAALTTLGWKGRRTSYGRSQLIGALKIIENGYASREQLKGSWAGAMGHTQFIPTTYLSYAIDHDGDGRRDIWSNLADVFASTANYLSRSGYRRDAPWGVEIRLPEEFDYGLAEPATRKALAEWAAIGVAGARGPLIGSLDPNLRGRIILPAGARGPAFMVFDNFGAILKYNRSTSYALAVGALADQIAGRRRAACRVMAARRPAARPRGTQSAAASAG